MNPLWNPLNKQASIFKWAEHLHQESKRVFLADKTHAHLIFSFKDEGPVGISPVPPKTDHAQIYEAIKRAIKDNDLYGVIHVGECWAYFPRHKRDHTVAQIMDGEIKVSELKDEDKSEVLYLRMENRDGGCVVYLDEILRNGGNVTLGDRRTLNGEKRNWF